MPEVPPMFKTAPLPWVSPPAPLKAVATVKVPVLVYFPVTVVFGMERPLAPLIVFVPVALVIDSVPDMVVVPLTVSANAPTVSVPDDTVTLLLTVIAAPSEADPALFAILRL